MSKERLQYLFERHLDKTCTPEEKQELFGLSLESGLEDPLRHVIAEAWAVTGEEEDVPETSATMIMASILTKPTIVIWRRIAVAASIILAISLGAYFLFLNKPHQQDEIVKTGPMKDVEAPKKAKAMITLANGQRVYLDSMSNGRLAIEGNVKLVKLANGQIAYEQENGKVFTEVRYNTLENPIGSKVISIMLADGSKVWLNAGSSITYPVAFVGKERNLSITGEAYFEVAHNEKMPFKVSKSDVTISVLGTHFNVNAYDDEEHMKVTLLEGAVRVNKGSSSYYLKPGQQAKIVQVDDDNPIKVITDVNIDEVMAWKNGLFRFERSDIGTVMRQIGRWYDIKVEYRGEVSQHFGGTISREANVSKVFEMLELTGGVKFNVIDNKVIVYP